MLDLNACIGLNDLMEILEWILMVVGWGIRFFGHLSLVPLQICNLSHGWWNFVIFVLNDRRLRVLWFDIFCGFYRGLCWDWLRFPFWVILKSPCFEFFECIWFGIPIYFGMPFLPRFRDTGLFRYANCLSDFELRAWFQSTGIFRCAEISWFGRLVEIRVLI